MDKKWVPTKRGLCVGIFLLTVCAAGLAYGAGHHEVAGPTWWGLSVEKLWDFLWRTLNFTALVIILVKFGAKPFANAMSSRQMAIKEQFDSLEAKKAEADKSYQAFETKLSQIDQEVKKIIETAIAQGEAERTRIIDEANRAADDIKRQAEMAVKHEMAAARLMLREEVANQAVLMAESLIRKNLQQPDQVKLVEDYLQKVGRLQ